MLTRSSQRGLTLIELMVALVISLIIVLAAVASLTVARRGFNTVDAASQLRDNGRFAADLIQRVSIQAGHVDARFAGFKCEKNLNQCPPSVDASALISPNVMGFDNAKPSATDPVNEATAHASGAVGAGSDVLVLRYQVSSMYPVEGTSAVDGSIVDCLGAASKATAAPIDLNDRLYSVLYVGANANGEPTLLCYRESNNKPGSMPLVDGVETFQVLYGVNGVVPLTAPVDKAPNDDSQVPERYLRASQMVVKNDTKATAANWRRVRALRIGLVIRGPENSAQDREKKTYHPFGIAPSQSGGSEGSAFASTDDAGSMFSAPADGRLRQVVTFTVQLRNSQDY